MDGFKADKKYEAYRIPGQQQFKLDGGAVELPQTKANSSAPRNDGMFYEIEYDSSPFPGVGKFVLKPQKIEEPEKDELRELFGRMREIARIPRVTYDQSRFYDPRVQHDNAFIFYKQGMFMKDFYDNYSGNAPFSQYFPYYQMMGYDQLRTYFTWRSKVRRGEVADTSLSYAFLYLYELLSNIGVNDPQEGLTQLMSFWKIFRTYNESIDKYVIRWLKDYHIYYGTPLSFKDFIDENNLTAHYPSLMGSVDEFDLFCTISKYDIRKSSFFIDDNGKLIKDCFSFVINRTKQIFTDNGISFDEAIFQPTRKLTEWKPFKGALFYNWRKQPDRRVVLSENEIYICSKNKWTFSTVITSESGRQLIGYIMKQMEAALRKLTKYKYKLTASIDTVTHEAIGKLKKAGLSLEAIINNAVTEFYKEAIKTVVTVDPQALSRIRQEALVTQERLIVSEQDMQVVPVIPPGVKPLNLSFKEIQDKPLIQPPESISSPVNDAWVSLKNALTAVEIKALAVILQDEAELKKYADSRGIMLEVLVEGINDKAMDYISDSLIDEEFILYDDYKEQVKELIE